MVKEKLFFHELIKEISEEYIAFLKKKGFEISFRNMASWFKKNTNQSRMMMAWIQDTISVIIYTIMGTVVSLLIQVETGKSIVLLEVNNCLRKK